MLRCNKFASQIPCGPLPLSCRLIGILSFTTFSTDSFVLKAKGKSILDVDPEARAFLEMTGKCRQSEGLREPVEEEEDDDDN